MRFFKAKFSKYQTPIVPYANAPSLCATPPSADSGQRGTPLNPSGRGELKIGGSPSGTTVTATAAAIPTFIDFLQAQTSRNVIDKTNVNGLLDFKLQYSFE